MNLEDQPRPRTRNRLLLYVAISMLGSLMAGLTLPMFGDGTVNWPQFRFMWSILLVKMVFDAAVTVRAFIDRTPSEEKEEQRVEQYRTPPAPPLDPPVVV